MRRTLPARPLAALLRFVAGHRLIPPGSRVIAAVSGGGDSTALLHLLLAARAPLGVTVEVAHFDHRLRGRSSARDAAFVRAAARRLGLRFHLGAGRPFTARERRARSIQELAREQRIGFFLRLARRRRAVVALGHTADDQAETFLMRLLTGGGPAALGGIPPASHGGLLLHPLLDQRGAALRAWLDAQGVRYREDPSNRSPRYLRNRVRCALLPLLAREYNPRIVERLAALAALLRRDGERLDAEAAALLAGADAGAGEVRIPARTIASAHPALLSRAVLAAARRLAAPGSDLTGGHIETLLAAGPGSRTFDLPGGLTALRDRRGLLLARGGGRRTGRAALAETPLPLRGHADVRARRIRARTLPCPPAFDPRRFAAGGGRVALDLDRVRPPLTVRGRKAGDRFRPLGLPAEKRLKEFLIDAKVPAADRAALPLVCDREGIVWVAGMRPAERCRVTGGTKRLLVLTLEGPGAARATPRGGGGAAPPPRLRSPAGAPVRRGAAASGSGRRPSRGRRPPSPG